MVVGPLTEVEPDEVGDVLQGRHGYEPFTPADAWRMVGRARGRRRAWPGPTGARRAMLTSSAPALTYSSDLLHDAVGGAAEGAGGEERRGRSEALAGDDLDHVGALAREGEDQVHAPAQRRRVPPLRLAPPVGDGVELAVAIGADVGGVPAVGVLGGDAQRALLPRAADPDRQPVLHRGGQARRVDRAEVLALVRGAVLGEEAADQRERLLELVEAAADRREVVAEGLGLGLVPPRAEAELEAAAGDVVERRRGLREQARVPVEDAEHEAAECGPGWCRRPARRACSAPRSGRSCRRRAAPRRGGPTPRSSRRRRRRAGATGSAAPPSARPAGPRAHPGRRSSERVPTTRRRRQAVGATERCSRQPARSPASRQRLEVGGVVHERPGEDGAAGGEHGAGALAVAVARACTPRL